MTNSIQMLDNVVRRGQNSESGRSSGLPVEDRGGFKKCLDNERNNDENGVRSDTGNETDDYYSERPEDRAEETPAENTGTENRDINDKKDEEGKEAENNASTLLSYFIVPVENEQAVENDGGGKILFADIVAGRNAEVMSEDSKDVLMGKNMANTVQVVEMSASETGDQKFLPHALRSKAERPADFRIPDVLDSMSPADAKETRNSSKLGHILGRGAGRASFKNFGEIFNSPDIDGQMSDLVHRTIEQFKSGTVFNQPVISEASATADTAGPVEDMEVKDTIIGPSDGAASIAGAPEDNRMAADQVSESKSGQLWINRTEFVDRVSKMMDDYAIGRSTDSKSIEIQLLPEKLGKVKISLKMENGEMRSEFICRPEAVDIIKEGIPKLRDTLAQSGVMLGDSFVGTQKENDNRQSQNRDENTDKKTVKEITADKGQEKTTATLDSTRYDFLI